MYSKEKMIITVPAQTDVEYSSVASNQCSWAAAEFALHSQELCRALESNDTAKFTEIYKECLRRASELRSKTSGCLYGENIDTPILEEHYKRNMSGGSYLEIFEHLSIIQNTDVEFVKILHPDLAREFYTRTYNERSIGSIANQVRNTTCLLVSRHGQSLAIIPFNTKYLICDSHLHQAKIVSQDDMIHHCLMDHGGHLHMTLMLVYPIH